MIYKIRMGIAACQTIYPPPEAPNWRDTGYPGVADSYHAVYLGPELLDPHGSVMRVEYDRATPMEVKAEVNKRFGMLFSIPLHRRQALIDTMGELEIEVQG